MSQTSLALLIAEHDALNAIVRTALHRADHLQLAGRDAEAGELRWSVMLERQRRDVLAMCIEARTAAQYTAAQLVA